MDHQRMQGSVRGAELHLGSPRSLACHSIILGLPSFCDHVSQFLIYIYMCVYMYNVCIYKNNRYSNFIYMQLHIKINVCYYIMSGYAYKYIHTSHVYICVYILWSTLINYFHNFTTILKLFQSKGMGKRKTL